MTKRQGPCASSTSSTKKEITSKRARRITSKKHGNKTSQKLLVSHSAPLNCLEVFSIEILWLKPDPFVGWLLPIKLTISDSPRNPTSYAEEAFIMTRMREISFFRFLPLFLFDVAMKPTGRQRLPVSPNLL